MTPKEAQQIIKCYGAVMEQHLGRSLAGPESALPCDKEMIKTAIRTHMLALKHKGHLDDETANNLRLAYTSLGDFIPDEEAAQVAEMEPVMAADEAEIEATLKRPEQTRQLPHTGLSERALAIHKRMVAESRQLHAELCEWEKSVGLRHPSEDRERALERAETSVDKMMKPAQKHTRRQIRANCGARLHQQNSPRWWQCWMHPVTARVLVIGAALGMATVCVKVVHTPWAVVGCGGGLIILGAGGYRLSWSHARHCVNKSYPGLADVSGPSSSPDGLHLWHHMAGALMPSWIVMILPLFPALFLSGIAVLFVGLVPLLLSR